MSDVLVVGDRVRISMELLREVVVREILCLHYPALWRERQIRVSAIHVEPEGCKVITFTNTDETGQPLQGWTA
jgi:hypothetical protein